MSNSKNEKYQQAIQTIGQEKIEKLYLILGDDRFSIGTLKRVLLREKVKQVVSYKESITDLSKKLKISRMTIYRHLKSPIKSN